jgi:uncharacterized protein
MEKEITIQNTADQVALAGTLTTPDNVTPAVLVILLHGTGGHTRDQVINTPLGPLPMFKLLSDYFVKSGIAVLRYDKRGAGKSSGLPFPQAVTGDYARDAAAVIRFAKQQKDIPFKSLGLVGHSEGCTLAAMAAAETNAVDFLALLAPPAERGDVIWLKQQKSITRQQGAPENVIALLDLFNQKAIETLAGHANDDEIMRILNEFIKNMREVDRQTLGIPPEGLPKEAFGELLAPRFRDFITVDPQEYYRKLSIPILAVYGAQDVHVLPAENATAIRRALMANGNSRFSVEEIPGLNHFFFAEGGAAGQPFPIKHAEIVANWIKGLMH